MDTLFTLKHVNSRVTPTEPYVPTIGPLPFLEDTLGVGFRPYPKGEMHVNRVSHNTYPYSV